MTIAQSGFAALPPITREERVSLQNREMDFCIAGRDGWHFTTKRGWKVMGEGDNRYFYHPTKGTLTRSKTEAKWIGRDASGKVKTRPEFFPYMALTTLDFG